MWQKVVRIWDGFLDGTGYASGILLALIMLLVTVSVAMRYTFSLPIEGAEEISGYMILYSTFLGAAWVLKRGGHVSLEVFMDLLRPKRKVLLNCITSFISFLVLLLLFERSLMAAMDYYQRGTVLFYSVLRMRIHLLYWPIVFGSFLLCIECLRQVYKQWHMSRQGKP